MKIMKARSQITVSFPLLLGNKAKLCPEEPMGRIYCYWDNEERRCRVGKGHCDSVESGAIIRGKYSPPWNLNCDMLPNDTRASIFPNFTQH